MQHLDKLIDNIIRYEALLEQRARAWEAEYIDLVSRRILLTMDEDHGFGVDFLPVDYMPETVVAIDMRMDKLDRYLQQAYDRLKTIQSAYEQTTCGLDEEYHSVVRRRALRLNLLSGAYNYRKADGN